MCADEVFNNLFLTYLGKKILYLNAASFYVIPNSLDTCQAHICVKYFTRLLLVTCLHCADSVLSTSEMFHWGKKKKKRKEKNLSIIFQAQNLAASFHTVQFLKST